ncbi:MAG: hypothetical protein IKO57_04245 [Treponema sp.]|nr:hypothetical protein [Treponema sp.]
MSGKKIALFFIFAVPFVFAGCGNAAIESEKEQVQASNDNSSSTENESETSKTKNDEGSTEIKSEAETDTEQEQTNDDEHSGKTEIAVDYSVGNKITFGGMEYYVVSNTVDSVENSGAQEISGEIAEIIETVSVSEAKKWAVKYFGEMTILLLRTKGMVYVPYGQKSEYEKAYNALTSDLTDSQNESYYFYEKSDPSKNVVCYKDVFLVLGESKERLGECKICWKSNQNGTFDDGKTLFDLLKDFSAETLKTIRNTRIGEYQISKYDNSKNLKYDFELCKFDENGRYRFFTTVLDAMYITSGKIYPASRIINIYDANGNWTKSQIYLCAVYKSDTSKGSFDFSIDNNCYRIRGASGSISGANIQFDENNIYTSENVVIPEDADIYSDIADMRYDENALSVPIELIKNEDGSISFGPRMLEWAKKWRDYIVETHEDAVKYE